MRFAIVGCGLIGWKRAAAISRLGHLMGLAVDHKRDCAVEIGGTFGFNARAETDFKAAAEAADVDAVVVATPHWRLSKIAAACLYGGKHVLVEKPGGRNPRGGLRRQESSRFRRADRKDRSQSSLPSGYAQGA